MPKVSAAPTPEPVKDYDLMCIRGFDCPVYDPNASCAVSADPAGKTTEPGDLDIKSIVDKYKIHSAMIKEVGGAVRGSHMADEWPATPASTMKLVIVDTVLQSGIDLDKSISVTRDLFYDGNNDLSVSSITVRDAITRTLRDSSNVGANALMKVLGGPEATTQKAQGYGYTHTTIKGNYDPSSRGKNKSSISDQVKAMDHEFTTQGEGYEVARSASQAAVRSTNHYNVAGVDAVKAAWTDTVAGNVGKFKIGGKDYLIGIYKNGNSASSEAITAIRSGSADMVKLVESGASGGAQSAASQPGQQCCPVSGDTDAGDGDKSGSGGDGGSWNSGLSPPYILEQWAIETLKDLAKKKGVSEADAVTKEHVIALVAFAMGEGGDIMNSSIFNPLNTGLDSKDLLAGAHDASGRQGFKSFDAGVEGTARTFAKPQYSRLAKALTTASSTAKQFMYALSYNWKYPDGAIWAEASKQSGYYQGRLNLVKQVRGNYKGTAALIIGTTDHEQAKNITEPSKLQFDGGGSVSTDDTDQSCSAASGDAQAIVDAALEMSWPDASKGPLPNEAYLKAFEEYNKSAAGVADCGVFVATVMIASGADKDYPKSFTGAQEAYVRAHPEKYDIAEKISSVSELKPGDILIVNKDGGAGGKGHTMIYVGPQPPNNYDAASASLGTRAGNLGKVVLSDHRGDYIRARLK